MHTFESLTGINATSFTDFAMTRTADDMKKEIQTAFGHTIADKSAQYVYDARGDHVFHSNGDKVAFSWTHTNALTGWMFIKAGLGRNPAGSTVLAFEKENNIEFPRLKAVSALTFSKTDVIAFMRGITHNAPGQVFSGVAGSTLVEDKDYPVASVKRLTALKLSERAARLEIKQSVVLPFNPLYVNAYATPLADDEGQDNGSIDMGACLNIGQTVAVRYKLSTEALAIAFRPNQEIVGMVAFPIAELKKATNNPGDPVHARLYPTGWLVNQVKNPDSKTLLSTWREDLLKLSEQAPSGHAVLRSAMHVLLTPNNDMRNHKEKADTPLPAMLEGAQKLGLLPPPSPRG